MNQIGYDRWFREKQKQYTGVDISFEEISDLVRRLVPLVSPQDVYQAFHLRPLYRCALITGGLHTEEVASQILVGQQLGYRLGKDFSFQRSIDGYHWNFFYQSSAVHTQILETTRQLRRFKHLIQIMHNRLINNFDVDLDDLTSIALSTLEEVFKYASSQIHALKEKDFVTALELLSL